MLLFWFACVEPRLTVNCRQLVAEQSTDCGTDVFTSEGECVASGCTEAEVDDLLEWAWCENDACVDPKKAEPCDLPALASTCQVDF